MVEPYVPPEKEMAEFTVKAVLLGVILALIMGAANAYLGLYAGMTVSATIPAAVISMAVFRALNGTILETNLSKTIASAGESLAAGVIFTIPAFLIIGAWTEVDYVKTTVIALLGGVLGVLFTISLRRILIVELDLPFPEGVACTEVLIAGEEGGRSAKTVFTALVGGLLFKLFGSEYGFRLWKERTEGIFSVGRAHFYGGSDLSVALLGVGYIVGPRIASMVFLGGVIGWVILVPIFLTIYGIPSGVDPLLYLSEEIWRKQTMWVGIGAIIVGGLYTMWSIRSSVAGAVRRAMGITKSETKMEVRTERDLPIKYSLWAAAAMIIPIAILYYYLIESGFIAGISAIIMLAAAFFFTAIAGYLAGVVGSSNNPISGVTISTLLFASLLLLAFGAKGTSGMATALGVGAVVCCAAAIAGDVMQDFKTGQLVGSTPAKLQMGEMIGVVATALILAPILTLLYQVYGIGVPTPEHPHPLRAPQAMAMGTLLSSMFGQGMNVPMFLLGAELAVLLIMLKRPILPIAIGIYLPLTLAVPIMLGGIIHLLVDKAAKKEENREKVHSQGVLFSAGLVAGEALMGIILAVFVIAHFPLNLPAGPFTLLGICIFLGFGALLMHISAKGAGTTLLESLSALKEVLKDVKERRAH